VARRYGAYADWKVVRYAKRYTFLIDPQGKIAKTYLKVDTSRHSAEIIADLRELQSVPTLPSLSPPSGKR
jgi:peroxiredoxin Q/BCP